MEHLGYDFTIGACQSHLASLRQPFAETDRVDAFGVEHLIQLVAVSIKSGCWFGTLIVPYTVLGIIIKKTGSDFSEGWLNHQPEMLIVDQQDTS